MSSEQQERPAAKASSASLQLWTLVALVVVVYGSALFANSIAVSLLGDAMPTSLSIFLNAVGRAIGAFTICGVLWLRKARQSKGQAGTVSAPAAESISLRDAITILPKFLIILVIPMLSYSGYVFYIELSRDKGNVSVLSPIVGLYGVVPIGVGLVFRGEPRTLRKLAGIVLSCLAILVLGMASNPSPSNASEGSIAAESEGSSAGAWLLRGVLFLGTFLSWGISDLLSASVRTDPLTSIFVNCIGQLMCATVSGYFVFATYTQRLAALQNTALAAWKAVDAGTASGNVAAYLPPKDSVISPTLDLGWPHALLLVVNALSVVAWLAYCRLGQLAPMSTFIPIVNSYACLPVALAVIFMGETITWLKAAGIALAVAAIFLISGGKSPAENDRGASDGRTDAQVKPADGATTADVVFAPSKAHDSAAALSDGTRGRLIPGDDNKSNGSWGSGGAQQYVFSRHESFPSGVSGGAVDVDVAVVDGGTGGHVADLNPQRQPSPSAVTAVYLAGADSTSGQTPQHPALQRMNHSQQPSFSTVAFPASPSR